MKEKRKNGRNRNRKRTLAFCLAAMLCLSGIIDYVPLKAADGESKNVALASNGTRIFTDKPNAWAEDNRVGIGAMIDGDREAPAMVQTDGLEDQVENITLEFARTYKVDSIVLYKYVNDGFPKDFTVSAYTQDGWKEVDRRVGYEAQDGANTFGFSPVDCSAIRLTVTKNGQDAGNYVCYISEFEVYGVESDVVISDSLLYKNAAAAANGGQISADRSDNMEDYRITRMNDGDTAGDNFGIVSSPSDEEYAETNITVNFAENWHIDTVRLYKSNNGAFPVDFTIEALSKGEWKTVHTETGYNPTYRTNSFSFEGIDCTAVRLKVTKQGQDTTGWGGYSIYLSELEAWGTATHNVALASNGTEASTSHPNSWAEGEEVGYGIANVNDGIADTSGNQHYFMAAMDPNYKNEKMEVSLKFGETYQVDTVRLHPGRDGAFPVNFEIQAYTASGWQTVVTKTNYAAETGWNTFRFDPVDCSAVVLVTTENGVAADGNYGIMLSEFEVYGKPVKTTVNVALASNGTSIFTDKPNRWAEDNGFGIGAMIDGECEAPAMVQTHGLETEAVNITLEFERTYEVDSIVLYKHTDGGFPVDFKVSAYTKEGWKEVVSSKGYKSQDGANTFGFSKVDCLAIRLEVTKNGEASGGNGYQCYIPEIQVYGKSTTTAVSDSGLKEDLISSVEAMIERLDVATDDVSKYISYWCEKIGPECIVNYGQFISKTAKENDPLVVPYSRADYEDLKKDNKAPTKEGYVFTGWFTSSEVVSEDGMKQYALRGDAGLSESGSVYARFVGETMLDVKAQLSVDSSADSPTASIRFLTTIDNKAYSKIGFKIKINNTEKDTANNMVYKTLNDTYIKGIKKTIKPEFFHKNAAYFKAATIYNIPSASYDLDITVTPYLVTLDGTTVYGTPVTKTVNQGIAVQGGN